MLICRRSCTNILRVSEVSCALLLPCKERGPGRCGIELGREVSPAVGTGRLDTRGHFLAAWNWGPESSVQHSCSSVLSNAFEGQEGFHPCGPRRRGPTEWPALEVVRQERKPGRATLGRSLFPEIHSAARGSSCWSLQLSALWGPQERR